MDKKKKIIIGIAIVLAIALVVGLFFLLNKEKEPEEWELNVRNLMELNEEYFKTLDSVDVTVYYKHNWTLTQMGKTTSGLLDLKCDTKKNFKTGETEAHLVTNHIDGDYKNKIAHNLYIENQNSRLMSYVQEIENDSINNGWFLNATHPQLYNIASATDFDYIGRYWLGLSISDEIIEVDGIRCYKVFGTISNFEKIGNHYGIYEQIGFFSDPFDSYAYVELYFREDNYIIHSFTYDFTDYWMETRANINGGNDRQGTMTLSVVYNDFNIDCDIVVSDDIKKSAVEELKDPIYYPIEFNKELYNIKIENITLKIGDKLAKYEDVLDLNASLYKRDNGECNGFIEDEIVYINPQYNTTVIATLQSGKEIMLTVVNISDKPLQLKECFIVGFSVSNIEDIFSMFNIANGKVNHKTTVNELRDMLGAYNLKTVMEESTSITWRSYIDWSDLTIVTDNQTGRITSLEVLCFNLESMLNGETLQELNDRLMSENNNQ